MKQIPFGSSAVPLRFEFPSEWPVEDITGLTLTVYDRDNNVLMAADAATLWTATTLDGAVSRFDDEVTLAAGADALKEDDTIIVKGIEGSEYRRVKGWDSTNKVVAFSRSLDNEYADGDSVYGPFADYELDISVTATYTAGIILRLLWTPTGGGQAVEWLRQVSKAALDIAGIRQAFADVYPRAYAVFNDPREKFERMRDIAEQQLTAELMANGMDIQRIVDQEMVKGALMAKMALLWTLNGDEKMEDESKRIHAEYASQIGYLKKLPLWLDLDQDGIETEKETQRHATRFDGWRPW